MLALPAQLHRGVVRGGALDGDAVPSGGAVLAFLDLPVRKQRLDHHADAAVLRAPVGEVAVLDVLEEVIEDSVPDLLSGAVHVKGVPVDVDVRPALLLHLLQHVEAGGGVDDKLVVRPAVRAVDVEAAADAFDHEIQEGRQGDLRELRVRDGLPELEKVVLALQGDRPVIGADALQPSLELLHHADLLVAEVDHDAVAPVDLLLHVQGGVVLRAWEGDHGGVGELLHGAAHLDLLDHPQPVVSDGYVKTHRKHRFRAV